MKKIFVILVLLFSSILNKTIAQNGIDFSLTPVNYLSKFSKDDYHTNINGNQYGFKLGYFRWVNDRVMLNHSIQYTTASKDFIHIEDVFNSSNPNAKSVKTNYTSNLSSYIYRYEANIAFNEIDFKSHHLFRSAWLFGISTESSVLNSTIYIPQTPRILTDGSKSILPILGFELGYGYQYNIKPKIGLYADVNLGIRLIEALAFFNTDIGVRYRLK